TSALSGVLSGSSITWTRSSSAPRAPKRQAMSVNSTAFSKIFKPTKILLAFLIDPPRYSERYGCTLVAAYRDIGNFHLEFLSNWTVCRLRRPDRHQSTQPVAQLPEPFHVKKFLNNAFSFSLRLRLVGHLLDTSGLYS